MKIYSLLLVGVGGFAGSIARYVLSRSIDRRLELLVPYGTLVVNILGSAALGLIYALAFRKADGEAFRLLLGVGFCGGFTTFSSFALENFLLLQQKHLGEFLLYATVTFVLCMAGVAVGVWLGNKV